MVDENGVDVGRRGREDDEGSAIRPGRLPPSKCSNPCEKILRACATGLSLRSAEAVRLLCVGANGTSTLEVLNVLEAEGYKPSELLAVDGWTRSESSRRWYAEMGEFLLDSEYVFALAGGVKGLAPGGAPLTLFPLLNGRTLDEAVAVKGPCAESVRERELAYGLEDLKTGEVALIIVPFEGLRALDDSSLVEGRSPDSVRERAST